MRRWIESLETFGIDVILERRYGKRASVLRAVLRGLSWLFRGLVQLRLRLYRERFLRDRPLGCMVVCVGNLTVGGTGKTPVVEKLARALQAGGRRVAILSRGYKSRKPPPGRRLRAWWRGERADALAGAPRIVSDGLAVRLGSREAGDEPFMLASNLPGIVVLVDKDRVKAGRWAVEHFGADTLLLDDGLQYLPLRHGVDLVLVDRTAPFGNEFLLPRGTLREPPGNLRRAAYVVITKCTGAPGENDELIARVRRFNRTAPIIECAHRPQFLREVYYAGRGRVRLGELAGRYVGAFSAIASPEGFEDGLRRLGATVELSRRFIDHHRFREEEIRAFAARCRRRDVEWIVTTEKDAVRFPKRLDPPLGVPVYFLRVEIEILSGHDAWADCIARICRPPALLRPREEAAILAAALGGG